MKTILGFAALPIFGALLTVCSGVLTTSAHPPPDVTTGTGNWVISGLYETAQAIVPYSFGGSLINNNGQLSGVFHINQPCFGSGSIDIPYTGTVDAMNNVSIQSAPVAGQVLTFQGVLAKDGTSITEASFKITGGCSGNIAVGTVDEGPGALEKTTAFQIPDLAGSWTSSTVVSGPSISEQIAQSSSPDSHGDYVLTGTVTVQGSECFTQGTLQPGSYISGGFGQEIILMDEGSTLRATLNYPYLGSAPTRTAPRLYPGSITGGKCDGPVDEDLD